MKKRYAVYRFLMDWLLLVVGILGSIYCLVTAFELPVSDEGLWSIVIICVTVNCFALGHKHWDRITVPVLLAGLALLIWLIHEELFESFRNLWYELSTRYARGYDWVLDFIPRDPPSEDGSFRALLFLPMLQSFFCCLSVRVWKRTAPAALVLLVGVLPCFILLDTPPALLPLLAAVFSVLAQAMCQSVRRREPGEHGKAAFLAALFAAGLLAALLWIFPQERYSPPLSWQDLTEQMQRWGAQQNNRGNLNAGLSGNPDEVDLAALGALPNHPSTALYVQSSVSGYTYLRGSSYTEFDGAVWTRSEERAWPVRTVYPYLGQTDADRLSVETVYTEPLFYTTYQVTGFPAGAEPVSDAFLRNPEGAQRYASLFLADAPPVEPDPDYDAWVRETCLALPEETREGVLAWWEEQLRSSPLASPYGLSDGSLDGVVIVFASPEYRQTYAQTVANLISTTARYSRNPDKVPEGMDFCTWFLNDAETGYCVHYASACTALLRALGIPARYVSGYVCNLPANERTAVTNLQAHAWVEIWNGGRWVVVEPTPDDATEFTGNAYIPGSYGETEATEPVISKPYERPSDPLPTDIYQPTTPTRSSREPSDSSETDEPGGSNSTRSGPRDLTPFWIFLGVVGFLALVLGRRALALRLWEKKLARAGINDRARLYWRRILRLHRHGGGEIPEEARTLAGKACFSQHTLQEDELRFLRQLCDQQGCRVAISGFWRKLYCKYILAII